MEPITDPVPGKCYFGYQCRCKSFILLSLDPEKGPAPFTATEPITTSCPYCREASSVAPVEWQRFVAS